MVLILFVWILLKHGVTDGQGELVGGGVLPWMGIGKRFLNSIALVGTYTRLFVFPLSLSTSYVHILSPGGLAEPADLIAGAVVLVLVLFAIRVALKRGSVWVGWGLAWWVLALLPSLPIFGKWGRFASEMFFLLPTTGLVVALAALTASWIPGKRAAGAGVVGLVCALLGARTVARASDFQSNELLLQAQRRAHPKNAEFLYQEGNLKLSASKWTDAQSNYVEATGLLEIDPRIWINLGITFHREESFGLAVRSLITAVRLIEDGPKDPTLAYRAHYHLGLSLTSQGQFERAATSFEMALRYRPESIPILANLGFAYGQEGKYDQALLYLNRALELETDPSKMESLRKTIQEIEVEKDAHKGHSH
jgi:Flp pilus assembly protein TadD